MPIKNAESALAFQPPHSLHYMFLVVDYLAGYWVSAYQTPIRFNLCFYGYLVVMAGCNIVVFFNQITPCLCRNCPRLNRRSILCQGNNNGHIVVSIIIQDSTAGSFARARDMKLSYKSRNTDQSGLNRLRLSSRSRNNHCENDTQGKNQCYKSFCVFLHTSS